MSKVMLVEDDNNLREIYEARLAAEGYEIISAADGEAALALAIKEKPDLIISDIMMPKVSGFDMLDILRSTTETKNIKIIMMTALNQAEDKERAEKLGADIYLVKSQVTLEDVVRSVKGLLGEETPLSVGGVPVQAPATPAEIPAQNTTSMVANAPVVPVPVAQQAPAPEPVPPVTPEPEPAPTPTNLAVPTPAQPAQGAVPAPAPEPAAQLTPTSAPTAVAQQAQAPVQSTPVAPTPVAQQAPAAPTQPTTNSADLATSTADEEAILQQQIEQYISGDAQTPTPAASPATKPITNTTPAPTPNVMQPNSPAPSPSSMAQPPSSLATNTPQAGDPNADRPAGEQVLVKNASADLSNNIPGIDASISGRKKVIEPINDVMAKTSNLESLAAKESGAEDNQPQLSSIITPQGSTLSASNGTPTMNDVIPPNPPQINQASANPTEEPLPPPVA